MTHPFVNRSRLIRLAGAVAAPLVAAMALLLAPPWLAVYFTPGVRWRAAVGFLVGLEVAYVVTIVAAAVGSLVFGGRLCRARRRPASARGLLVCIAFLVAVMMAESGAAWRRASLHRTPGIDADLPELPARFDEPASGDEVTLAVLGESSAVGLPYEEWLSVGRIVAWQLGRAIPSRRFCVELLARKGDTLEGQFRALAGLRRRPDAIIVYCGHNEFAAGIPWSRRANHYLDERPPALGSLDELAARISPLCGLIRETADRFRVAIVPTFDSARPRLVDAPAYTPGELATRLEGFRRRLDAIAAFGERIGALTVLVVPPANDADFDPNRSFLPADTPRREREAFARDFLAAHRIEDSDPARAVDRYRALLARQPGFAEAHHRLGLLLRRAGAWEEAYRHFVAARDLDGLPARCLGAFHQAYRDVAARHDCALVDGQALFHAIGPHGLLDDHLFHDAVHPSLRGHVALAQAIVGAIQSRRALGWPAGMPAPTIDPAECAARFGIRRDDWKRIAERGIMFYYATAPLRYDPEQRLAKQRAFAAAAGRIAAGEPPEAIGLPNIGVGPSPPPRGCPVSRRMPAGTTDDER